MVKKIGLFICPIILCLIVGGLAGLITNPAIDSWYQFLDKPAFNPPNWLFAPVWTVLYVLMGLSLYLVLKNKSVLDKKKPALRAFAVQLVLNFGWSLVFFGFQLPWLAVFEILVLLVAIYVTMVRFWPFSKWSTYMLIPYILWVTFATILTIAIAVLN